VRIYVLYKVGNGLKVFFTNNFHLHTLIYTTMNYIAINYDRYGERDMNEITFGKADVHIHTTCSDGLMTPEALVDYVVKHTDLDVIAVTDHDTTEGAHRARAYARRHYPDFEVIIGQEVTSAECDILALYIHEDIPAGLSAEESIRRIHAQGGLAIAAHPYAFVMPMIGVDGMKGAGDRIKDLPFDGVEAINATPSEWLTNRRTQANNRRWQNLAETGGSDGHYLPTVGSAHTVFMGRTAADLRAALEARTTRAIGRVYSPLLIFNVVFDWLTGRLPIGANAPQPVEERQQHAIMRAVGD